MAMPTTINIDPGATTDSIVVVTATLEAIKPRVLRNASARYPTPSPIKLREPGLQNGVAAYQKSLHDPEGIPFPLRIPSEATLTVISDHIRQPMSTLHRRRRRTPNDKHRFQGAGGTKA